MKRNFIISVILTAFLLSLGLSSCSNSEPTLNAPVPTGSFTYNLLNPTSYAAPQNLQLISNYSNGMVAYWFLSDGSSYKGDTVKATIMFAGTYDVKLLIGGPGGLSDTIRQTITIDKDNPYAIDPNGLSGILTGAGLGMTQRTWVPMRVVNTVIVWDTYDNCMKQINGGGGAWWAFGPSEIATDGKGRDGYLDDQYTFTFGKVGQLIYNDNNTVYLDAGGSGWTKALPAPWNAFLGTTPSTDLYNLVPALKPWGSGTFSYSLAPAPAGAYKLGTVTLNGVGAHIGLPDKNNSGDDITPTATSITYDVLKLSTDLVDTAGTHYDEIVLGVKEPGLVWTFMFRANR